MTKPKLPREIRGKRPEFFQTEGVDDLLSMVLVVAQELTVLRERCDTAERVLAKHGINLAAEIEAFERDEDLLRLREQQLQDFYDRLFYVVKQRRSELEQKYSESSYLETLDKVATGDI